MKSMPRRRGLSEWRRPLQSGDIPQNRHWSACCCAWHRHRRAIIRRFNLLQEELGFRFWHRIELALERFAADVILAECLRALPIGRIKSHKHPMAFFAQWIDFEHPLNCRNRAFAVPSVRKFCQNVDYEVVQPSPLDR